MAIGGKAGEVFTDINVTPLTDVFLVLLVIMMLIAPQINQTVLKVIPPSASQSPQKPQKDDKEKINVFVTSTGEIKVNDKPVATADTQGVMAAIKEVQKQFGKDDLPLFLGADSNALEKYVVAVMDAAAGCDIKRLQVMPLTNSPKK